jgi:site-specific recombinase XerD
LPWIGAAAANVGKRPPVTLTRREVRALLDELNGTTRLVASLLYGTGTRALEGLWLRVKDVEFERREIVIRAGAGDKDRVTVLAGKSHPPAPRPDRESPRPAQ